MPTITIHKPADLQLVVIDGDPPIDQSAEVAALRARIVELTEALDKLQVRFFRLNAAIDAAQEQQ